MDTNAIEECKAKIKLQNDIIDVINTINKNQPALNDLNNKKIGIVKTMTEKKRKIEEMQKLMTQLNDELVVLQKDDEKNDGIINVVKKERLVLDDKMSLLRKVEHKLNQTKVARLDEEEMGNFDNLSNF